MDDPGRPSLLLGAVVAFLLITGTTAIFSQSIIDRLKEIEGRLERIERKLP